MERMETVDYRTMFDRDYIGAWDLPAGKDVVVVITKVEAKKLRNKNASNTKPVIYFKGKEKGFACNKTNGKTIAAMYGNDVKNWIGKPIAIYPTTTSFGNDTVECIRVRPTIPNQGKPWPESIDERPKATDVQPSAQDEGDAQTE